jgi:putative addiction module component (TIGR02574 family)
MRLSDPAEVLRCFLMTKDATRLFEDALKLAPGERAELAEELLASLDDTEADVERAWAAEIAKRAAEARANNAGEEDWRTALTQVRREVPKP